MIDVIAIPDRRIGAEQPYAIANVHVPSESSGLASNALLWVRDELLRRPDRRLSTVARTAIDTTFPDIPSPSGLLNPSFASQTFLASRFESAARHVREQGDDGHAIEYVSDPGIFARAIALGIGIEANRLMEHPDNGGGWRLLGRVFQATVKDVIADRLAASRQNIGYRVMSYDELMAERMGRQAMAFIQTENPWATLEV